MGLAVDVQSQPTTQAGTFPMYLVRGLKTDQREFIAHLAMDWVLYKYRQGASGAIMLDIDDTLIDGHECIKNGFGEMRTFFQRARKRFPMYIVTARPKSEHDDVMSMLHERGLTVEADRLMMLPTNQWGKDTKFVEVFKWNAYKEIRDRHGGVIVRLGDKMWDVSHIRKLNGMFANVKDVQCLTYMDPGMPGTLSGKLPGAR